MIGMENKLYELTRKRRSVRRYTEEEISDETLNEILKVALTAPSSWGGHPIEFIVVKDKQMIHKIARCKAMGAAPLLQADIAIVVAANCSGCELWIEDASVASSYILLAAEQYNIGACWIHIRNRNGKFLTADEEIRSLLGIPENYSVLNVIALGQKGEKKPSYTDKDLCRENIHRERF